MQIILLSIYVNKKAIEAQLTQANLELDRCYAAVKADAKAEAMAPPIN
jgi:hypothetical protein